MAAHVVVGGGPAPHAAAHGGRFRRPRRRALAVLSVAFTAAASASLGFVAFLVLLAPACELTSRGSTPRQLGGAAFVSSIGARAPWRRRVALHAMSEDEYMAMKAAELKDMLRERGLPVSGNKPDLVKRLMESSAEEEAEQTDEVEEAEEEEVAEKQIQSEDGEGEKEEEEEEEEEKEEEEATAAEEEDAAPDYASMKMKELQSLLKERGLPTSGKKPELINRLEEAAEDVPEAEGKETTTGENTDSSGEDDDDTSGWIYRREKKKEPEPQLLENIKKGDWVKAKQGEEFQANGVWYFRENDPGVCTNVFEEPIDNTTNETIVQVTWNKTQLVTHFGAEDWEEVIEVVEKDWPEPEEDDDDSPYGRRKWGDDNDFVGLGPGSPTWDPKKLQYFVGDLIECKRDGQLQYCRVAKNHANWSYNVKWDSDATETMVHYDELRKPRNPEKAGMPDWIQDWWPME